MATTTLPAAAIPDNDSPTSSSVGISPPPENRGVVQGSEQKEKGSVRLVQRMGDRASELVLSAMNFLGVPYRRGGSTDDGFDCSGFTRHIFEKAVGVVLPRRAAEQAHAPGLQSVPREELKPGDLVFFNTLRRAFSHVGIYIGGGKFIHAPRSGGEVRVEDMSRSYWAKRFNGARRAELVASAEVVDLAQQRPPVAGTQAEGAAQPEEPASRPTVTIPPRRPMAP